jgi:hypothetical protein
MEIGNLCSAQALNSVTGVSARAAGHYTAAIQFPACLTKGRNTNPTPEDVRQESRILK